MRQIIESHRVVRAIANYNYQNEQYILYLSTLFPSLNTGHTVIN